MGFVLSRALCASAKGARSLQRTSYRVVGFPGADPLGYHEPPLKEDNDLGSPVRETQGVGIDRRPARQWQTLNLIALSAQSYTTFRRAPKDGLFEIAVTS